MNASSSSPDDPARASSISDPARASSISDPARASSISDPARAYALDLLDFIGQSPSPWHATASAVQRLHAAGYQALQERDAWQLVAGGRYYVVRGGSSLIAFVAGMAAPAEAGFRLVGAHTDSPGLRLKPHAAHLNGGFLRLGVEVYGGPILATFTDRDLGLAGRVHLRAPVAADAAAVLLTVRSPVVRLPNLAIHMNREVNEQGLKLHRQNELHLLFATENAGREGAFHHWVAQQLQCDPANVLGVELQVCDVQPGVLWGGRQEFIASSQLDNLACTHAGLCALLSVQQPDHTAVAAFFDHEEVGSESAVGAAGSFFSDVLARISEALGAHGSDAARARAHSLFLSADMAHAWHPNFPAAYEPQHHLRINAGPAIKYNASQRYATDGAGAARFMQWCEGAGVPWQSYVHRSELGCGSTIGPLVAARLGIPTVDVGAPMWAMHSLRESAGALDSYWLHLAMARALQSG